MGAVKALLFDLDGVLADTAGVHYEALAWALAEKGAALSREEHDREFHGLNTAQKLAALTASGRLPAEAASEVAALKRMKTGELLASRCSPGPAAAALASLKSSGFRLAVVSNSEPGTVRRALALCGLDGLFEFSLSSADAPSPKPSPAIYLEALRRLGLAAGECLAFEDSGAGLESARCAGIRAVRVASPADLTENFIRAAAEGAEGK